MEEKKHFLSLTPTFAPRIFLRWPLKHMAWTVLAKEHLVQNLPYQLINTGKKPKCGAMYISTQTREIYPWWKSGRSG